MKLIIIFGPPAVGKMTVGKELSKITNLKLFHNHISLELVNRFYDFGTSDFRQLSRKIRFAIFRSVATSDLEGLIFTYVWQIDAQSDMDYVKSIVEIFEANDAEVFYVELQADLSERLKRNRGEARLAAKPSKRNIAFSEKNLLECENLKLNTDKSDLKELEILKIDNTDLSATDVATQIKKHFNL